MFQRMGWVLGSTVVLLLIIADGLALFAEQGLGPDNVATKLLALYLASWSYVLGLVGLVLFSVGWLVGERRVGVTQAANSRYSSTEPQRRRLETPELEDLPFVQQDVISIAPSRLSRLSDDRTEPASSARVA